MDDLRREVGTRAARRWFWGLLVVAVAAMGALYRALSTPPGGPTALAVLGSGLLLFASSLQAARILLVLEGPLRWRPPGPAAGREPGPSPDR